MTAPAHIGSHEIIAPGEALSHWGIDPLTLAWLTALAIGYAFAIHALSLRGAGRAVPPRRRLAYAAGLATAAVALMTPVEALSGTLLSVHMAQHMLLIALAAPLIAYGAPPLRFAAALPSRLRDLMHSVRLALSRRPGTAVLAAALAVLHATVVWGWHLPAAYELAVASTAIHFLEHMAFLATAVISWWAIFEFGGRVRPSPAAIGLLLFLAMQGAMLGALMAFAESPWYPHYAEAAAVIGIDPVRDQQVAGMLMWGFGGTVPFVAAMVLVVGWIGHSTRHPQTLRTDRRRPAGRPREGVRDAPKGVEGA